MFSASDIQALVQPLLRTDIPALPNTALRQACVQLLWGILLAAAGWRAGPWLQPRWRLGFTGLLAVWAVTPGPASPAYWLEMAFASPSWTSALLCGLWLLRQARQPAGLATPWTAPEPARIPWLWALGGILLGWVLALDTFAALPLADSLYAWGFSPLATLALMLSGSVIWLIRPCQANALPLLAVGLCVATRLPSGNVWDGMTDPLLWLYLHGDVAVRVWKQLRGDGRR